jgi:adenosylcobyric acid synthase
MRVVSRNGEPVSDSDGAVTPDGKVIGTYFHGIFDEPQVRRRFLSLADSGYRPARNEHGIEESYDLLARHVAAHLDLDRLYAMIDKPFGSR